MKIINIILIYLLIALTVLNADVTEDKLAGTWKLNTKNNSILSQLEVYLYFMVFKNNNKVYIPGLDKEFNWKLDNNNSAIMVIKDYTISANIKSENIDRLELEYQYKNKKHKLLYKKSLPLVSEYKPKHNVLYEAKTDAGKYIFILFSKSQYTLFSSKFDARDYLLFNKDKIKNKDFPGSWWRTSGRYAIKDKKIYLLDVLGVSTIDVINKSEYAYRIYNSRVIFKERSKKLKQFLSSKKLFYNASINLDLEILKLAFKYGYTLNGIEKESLLFDIVDKYIELNDRRGRNEKRKKKFMEVVKLLNEHGMKIDIMRKEQHPSISYVETIKPKLTLVKNSFYEEALFLVKHGVKVENLDLYFLMSSERKKVRKKILSEFLDHYKYNPNGENLIFSAIKYGDYDIEKRIFDLGFNNTKAIDCCYDLNVIDYIMLFGSKSKYKFLKYVLSKNICNHPYKNIKESLEYQQNKAKKPDKRYIKIMLNFTKRYEQTCNTNR